MPLAVFAHDPAPQERSPQARALRVCAEAARREGLQVIRVPDMQHAGEASAALSGLHRIPAGASAYSGPVPEPDAYAALEHAAARAGAPLINTAAASLQATQIDLWAPLLEGLTPRTVIVRDRDGITAAAELGWPVFVKGLVKSAKEGGLEACIAGSPARLELMLEARAGRRDTRGALAVREMLALRKAGASRAGFPESREYRVALAGGKVSGWRPYWGPDPFGAPEGSELQEMLDLARDAAGRLDAPLLAVDVAELAGGGWTVIEAGDLQHTALSHLPRELAWRQIAALAA